MTALVVVMETICLEGNGWAYGSATSPCLPLEAVWRQGHLWKTCGPIER
jgi:hypothetical protein